jgi:hypothetical protein
MSGHSTWDIGNFRQTGAVTGQYWDTGMCHFLIGSSAALQQCSSSALKRLVTAPGFTSAAAMGPALLPKGRDERVLTISL